MRYMRSSALDISMMNSRFQKITRDSSTYERRSLEGSDKRAVLIINSPGWIYRRNFSGAGIHCLFGFASEGMKCGPAPYCHDSKPAPKSHNQVNTFISQQLTTSKRGEKQVEKSVRSKHKMQR